MRITRRTLLGSMTWSVVRNYCDASESVRERNFDLEYEAALTNLPAVTEHFQFWMPVPHADTFQKIELLDVEAPVEYSMESGANGNQILHISKAPASADRLPVKLRYRVTRRERIARTTPTGLESASLTEEERSRY